MIKLEFRNQTDGLTYALNKVLPIQNTTSKVKYELVWTATHYSILIDGQETFKGLIADDFGIPGSNQEFIDDPHAKKPDYWVDNPFLIDAEVLKQLETTPEMIDDPTQSRPESYEG